MSNNFSSVENKGLLWSVLAKNGLFNGIPSHHLINIKSDFEINIQNTQNNFGHLDLVQSNKQFIQDMIQILEKYKQEPSYKKEDIKREKMERFQKNLETKQNSFIN